MVSRGRADARDLPGPQQVFRGRRPGRRCRGPGLGRDLGSHRQELRPARFSKTQGRSPESAPRPGEALVYAPFSHFVMKLVFAAPASGLPSALTALVAHDSAMHFFMNEVFAAPARALPSLLTALVSQDSCATAEPRANAVIIAAKKIRFIMCFSLSQDSPWIGHW